MREACRRQFKSGREDLNLRPVAAATALLQPVKFFSATASLVVSLTLRCLSTSGKGLTMEEEPRHSVFRRFGIIRIVAANSLSQILARADIATPSLLASRYVTIKHATMIKTGIGARGFEPPTSWSQTTRSTKLSYAPNRAESLP
jgi:hypothetical protein